MARRRRYKLRTRFWRSGVNEFLLIALFGLWLWVALHGEYRLAVALAVVITIVETI